MAVFRVKKTKDYVSIHKQALEDPRLSFKAKGLWAYCMSRKDDWVFHISHLITVSKEKKSAIYNALKELEKAGYIKKMQPIKENGRFDSVDYEIYEISKIKIISPLTDFPHADNPHADNQPLISIDNNKDRLITKERESTTSREDFSSEKLKKLAAQNSYGSHVKLGADEYNELIAKHGETVIRDIIEEINDYIDSKGLKPYKNYAATIRNWLKRRKRDVRVDPKSHLAPHRRYSKLAAWEKPVAPEEEWVPSYANKVAEERDKARKAAEAQALAV